MSHDTEPTKTILVVEDNQDSRELVIKVLKSKGYLVIEAADGEIALRILTDAKPDLILMDISLPKIDGLEVTRRIKEQESFKDIPIIALTAHAMKGDREKALRAGCDGYIPKPISVRELPDQIQTFFIQK